MAYRTVDAFCQSFFRNIFPDNIVQATFRNDETIIQMVPNPKYNVSLHNGSLDVLPTMKSRTLIMKDGMNVLGGFSGIPTGATVLHMYCAVLGSQMSYTERAQLPKFCQTELSSKTDWDLINGSGQRDRGPSGLSMLSNTLRRTAPDLQKMERASWSDCSNQ